MDIETICNNYIFLLMEALLRKPVCEIAECISFSAAVVCCFEYNRQLLLVLDYQLRLSGLHITKARQKASCAQKEPHCVLLEALNSQRRDLL